MAVIPKKDVLIVDDEQDLATVVLKLVERLGYAGRTANDGRSAMKAYLQAKPDLILLDVAMPEVDGLGVLDWLRKEGYANPVVMVTARTTDDDVLQGYRKGADYYLCKPFSNQHLTNVLKYFLGNLSAGEKEALECTL